MPRSGRMYALLGHSLSFLADSFDSARSSQYYCALMSDRPTNRTLPEEVEPRKFAHRGVNLEGAVPVAKLHRLQGAVKRIVAVEANLLFDRNEQGVNTVTGHIEADVVRECQRCLADLEQRVSCEVNLALVWDDEKARSLTAYEPWIVADETANLFGMVEDELLLNLPYLGYHDFACVAAEALNAGEATAAELASNEAKRNPFELLKQLKDTKKSN